MKRLVFLVVALLLLTACSVQETVSPQIYMDRIQKNDKNISFNSSDAFLENINYVCFVRYAQNADIMFEIAMNEQGSAKKINLACTQTDKIDLFVQCAQSAAETYAPDDDAQRVISELFKSREISDKCLYYDTQWHAYSAVLSENGLYFSVESKKLVPQSDVEMSLKQNDIVTY